MSEGRDIMNRYATYQGAEFLRGTLSECLGCTHGLCRRLKPLDGFGIRGLNCRLHMGYLVVVASVVGGLIGFIMRWEEMNI